MNNIFDFPDKLYCINLDSRKDRWAQASEEFLKVGIKDKFERISAKIDLDPRKGCLESHLLCISDAMKNSYENILIFEDDVYFF